MTRLTCLLPLLLLVPACLPSLDQGVRDAVLADRKAMSPDLTPIARLDEQERISLIHQQPALGPILLGLVPGFGVGLMTIGEAGLGMVFLGLELGTLAFLLPSAIEGYLLDVDYARCRQTAASTHPTCVAINDDRTVNLMVQTPLWIGMVLTNLVGRVFEVAIAGSIMDRRNTAIRNLAYGRRVAEPGASPTVSLIPVLPVSNQRDGFGMSLALRW